MSSSRPRTTSDILPTTTSTQADKKRHIEKNHPEKSSWASSPYLMPPQTVDQHLTLTIPRVAGRQYASGRATRARQRVVQETRAVAGDFLTASSLFSPLARSLSQATRTAQTHHVPTTLLVRPALRIPQRRTWKVGTLSGPLAAGPRTLAIVERHC